MRLQVAISEMGVGGAEKMVVESLRDAARRGDTLGLLAGPGRLDAELEGLEVERMALPTARTTRALLRAAGVTARFTRHFAPDLIHAHNVRVTATCRIGAQLARPLSRPPLLATYHGVPHEEVASAARLLRLADFVVCVSDDLRIQLEKGGVASRRLAVIPNGVPDAEPLSRSQRDRIDAEFEFSESTPVVSVVGRLVPQKAHDRFLRAAVEVKRRLPETRFLIIGDGELRREMEQLAAELGLGGEVRFTGIRDDAAELIARSDLLVFSSVWEGLSIAALEALARGVPVISTDVAGTRELLTSGAGTIVPQDDAALGAAIVDALEDPEARARMSSEGRRLHSERFSIARMNDDYRRIYADLVGR
jgi:glycosyltransferase involved in cell wall biosynthesis